MTNYTGMLIGFFARKLNGKSNLSKKNMFAMKSLIQMAIHIGFGKFSFVVFQRRMLD